MSAIICTQSRTSSMDYSLSRNNAGSALPAIPRRSSSTSRMHAASFFPGSSSVRPSLSTSASQPNWNSLAKLVVHPPTPPSPPSVVPVQHPKPSQNAPSDSDSTTASDSDGRPTVISRAKRVWGVRSDPAAAGSSTPKSLVLPAKAASLRIAIAPVILPIPEPKISIPPSVEARLIRKKSGQPVKSSLKSSKSSGRGDLATLGFAMEISSTRSEPVTPTNSKFVHFDSQDHVKLFLAEQKPLAVSRDGSPTEDTSGTESEFPSFIYSRGVFEPARVVLSMRLMNMPAAPQSWTDCALESLVLSVDGNSMVGNVRVRNLAFEKWLAVRFTFDSWQTTSEVTAKYSETIPSGAFPGSEHGAFDRFTFTVRLNDLLARIEDKTLLLALRYTVAGREIWDNNEGRNYQATFKKTKVARPRIPEAAPSPEVNREEESRMLNLKSRLEQVAIGREGSTSFFTPPAVSSPKDAPHKLTSGSLKSRYDFGASLRDNSWQRPPNRQRTNTFPAAQPSLPFSLVPLPSKSMVMGSPRDSEENYRPAPVHPDRESVPFPAARNHQRGYFDLAIAPNAGSMRKTPPGTPGSNGGHTRFFSFPPAEGAQLYPMYGSEPMAAWSHLRGAGSDESTPSVLSPSSSSTDESTQSPTEALLLAQLTNERHSQFLNQFCFYTGPGAETVPRSQSVSNVEEFLSKTSPRGGFPESSYATPTRSPSLDDVRSGATTPTSRWSGSNSRSTAPVAV